MQTVNLIDVNDIFETLALRPALEYWGYKTTLDPIGNVNQLVDLLSTPGKLSDIVVLMCHGDDNGLSIPELHPDLLPTMKFQKSLSPQDIQSFCQSDVKLIINSGCSLGTEAYAHAFLEAGCQNYLGAMDDPLGNDSLMFLLTFFYELSRSAFDIFKAYEESVGTNTNFGMFKLYTRADMLSQAENKIL